MRVDLIPFSSSRHRLHNNASSALARQGVQIPLCSDSRSCKMSKLGYDQFTQRLADTFAGLEPANTAAPKWQLTQQQVAKHACQLACDLHQGQSTGCFRQRYQLLQLMPVLMAIRLLDCPTDCKLYALANRYSAAEMWMHSRARMRTTHRSSWTCRMASCRWTHRAMRNFSSGRRQAPSVGH